MILQSENIYLELLSEENASPSYKTWMNDYEVTRFLESRFQYHDDASLAAFIKSSNSSNRDFLFGIFRSEDKAHVGNIKIGNVNWQHSHGDVGLLIGDPSARGKGFATQAITLITRYAFEGLNLHKLFAGIYSGNEGSLKAFLKAGWNEAGVLREHYFLEGKYADKYLVEIINR